VPSLAGKEGRCGSLQIAMQQMLHSQGVSGKNEHLSTRQER